MSDMLVRLYDLPNAQPLLADLRTQGIYIRRAIAPEKHMVTKWVGEHFSAGWVSETEVAYSNSPISCWIAQHEDKCVGFAVCEATAKAFFGPTGVDETYRGRGIGKALLLVCLQDLYARGYAYGIIGWPGPVEFYAKAVGAIEIPDSMPGVYWGMLREKKDE